MKLYNMKIDYLVHEYEMLDKLIYYTAEKAVKEIIKYGRIPGFEKDE